MKKKLIAIILCSFLFLLVGCVQKTSVDDTGSASAPTIETPPVATPPAAPPAATPPAAPSTTPQANPPATPPLDTTSTQPYQPPTMTQPSTTTPSITSFTDSKVASLVGKAKSKGDNYAFLYQTSENWDVLRDRYFILGDKMKIDLYDVNLYNKKNYFDMVYLDMAKKIGVAYCEDRHHQRCIDPDREFEIDYEDFKIVTPAEWMLSMSSSAKVVGTETFDKHLATVIEYPNADGTVTRIWVDTFSGLPLQVIVYSGDMENPLEKYGYRDLSVNSVRQSDVTHS